MGNMKLFLNKTSKEDNETQRKRATSLLVALPHRLDRKEAHKKTRVLSVESPLDDFKFIYTTEQAYLWIRHKYIDKKHVCCQSHQLNVFWHSLNYVTKVQKMVCKNYSINNPKSMFKCHIKSMV